MNTTKQLPAALNALLMTVKICTGAALFFVLAGCASPEQIAQKKVQVQAEKAQQAVIKKEYATKIASCLAKLKIGMSITETNQYMPDQLNEKRLLEKANDLRFNGTYEQNSGEDPSNRIEYFYNNNHVGVISYKHCVGYALSFDAKGKLISFQQTSSSW